MAENVIHIVGPNSLQNELFVTFLAQSTGFEITSSNALDQVPFEKEGGESKQLVLLDFMGMDLDGLWTKIGMGSTGFPDSALIALFNVDRSLGIEKEAINGGVRGVFYANESTTIFAKGVESIFGGEMWYPRKTMSQYLLESKSGFRSTANAAEFLTTREKEMLGEIASGATNQEIADSLYVSVHTVKTHIYNIYKKIKVTNRLQATLWAAKHM